MANRAVQKVVQEYFEQRSHKDSEDALEIWESTPCTQYDGDPFQFAECLEDRLEGFTVTYSYHEEGGVSYPYNPVITRQSERNS